MFDLFIIRYNHAFKIIQGILFKTILIKYLNKHPKHFFCENALLFFILHYSHYFLALSHL